MSLVYDPHDHHHRGNDQDKARNFVKAGDEVKVDLFFNNQDRSSHREDRQYLGVQVRIHDRSPFKQEKVNTQGHSKYAGNGHEIN